MEQNRFEMLKRHNLEEFEKAVEQGKADERIISLCAFLNSLDGFFTSSSCSGRIALLSVKSVGEKQPKAFYRRWHDRVGFKDFWSALCNGAPRYLWFKLEPFIVHVGARDLENAKRILHCMRLAGVKRGGIIVAEREKFLIELQGTHAMALPVKSSGKLLVSKAFALFLIKKANQKLYENFKRLKLFDRVCREELQ